MAMRKINLMHHLFGKTAGHYCRECDNLVKGRHHNRTYTKCKVYGETHSEASDWAQKYEACGMFNKPWTKGPVIRTVKPERPKQTDEPIEGQLSMDALT